MLNAAGQGIDSHATADFCMQDFQKVGFHEKLKFARPTNLCGTRKQHCLLLLRLKSVQLRFHNIHICTVVLMLPFFSFVSSEFCE